MEDVESKLRSSQVNSQTGHETFAKLAVNVEGFKKLVQETREEAAKIIDNTNSYLKESLNELVRQYMDQEVLNAEREKVIMLQKQVVEELPEFVKKVQYLERENATLKLDLQRKESDMESQVRDQTSLIDKKNEEVKKLQKMVYEMEVDLKISKELNMKMDEYMSEIALEKLADQELHEYQIRELNKKINDLLSQLPRP